MGVAAEGAGPQRHTGGETGGGPASRAHHAPRRFTPVRRAPAGSLGPEVQWLPKKVGSGGGGRGPQAEKAGYDPRNNRKSDAIAFPSSMFRATARPRLRTHAATHPPAAASRGRLRAHAVAGGSRPLRRPRHAVGMPASYPQQPPAESRQQQPKRNGGKERGGSGRRGRHTHACALTDRPPPLHTHTAGTAADGAHTRVRRVYRTPTRHHRTAIAATTHGAREEAPAEVAAVAARWRRRPVAQHPHPSSAHHARARRPRRARGGAAGRLGKS